MNPDKITGTKNAIVKETVRLRRKRNRYDRKLFLAEGEDLLESAITSGIIPRQVFVLEDDDELLKQLSKSLETASAPIREIEVFSCSRAVMEKISMLGSGSRIAAVFSFFDRPIALETSFPGKLPLIYLAGISDPGNLGTIIRSATALGATGILLDPDTADPYGHKAIRASMGAMFSIPLYIGIGIGEMVKLSKRLQRAIICADSQEGAIAWDVDLSGAYILAFGSERSGIPAAIGAASAYKVRIPQLDRKTDSINVAMAATAILYEAARQRSSA